MVVIALFAIGTAAIIAGTIQLLAALRMRRWPVGAPALLTQGGGLPVGSS